MKYFMPAGLKYQNYAKKKSFEKITIEKDYSITEMYQYPCHQSRLFQYYPGFQWGYSVTCHIRCLSAVRAKQTTYRSLNRKKLFQFF